LNKVQLEHILGESIRSIQTLYGGDIALAQRADTKEHLYFVKSAGFPNAKELFDKEVIGLITLEQSKTIRVPSIIGTYSLDGVSCLILEFIKSKTPQVKDMEHFGRQLAHLHLSAKTKVFGFETDNFIGKLPQSNQKHSDWFSFYAKERLWPQLHLAQDLKLLDSGEIPTLECLTGRCQEFFGEVSPSLLHGDLWSGNYLIDKTAEPYLIDPAVYYGHNEVDLAMSRLFGGFSTSFYDAYNEIIPPHDNQKELREIYQLYYLLVHLNLFGASYKKAVVHILKKYF